MHSYTHSNALHQSFEHKLACNIMPEITHMYYFMQSVVLNASSHAYLPNSYKDTNSIIEELCLISGKQWASTIIS